MIPHLRNGWCNTINRDRTVYGLPLEDKAYIRKTKRLSNDDKIIYINMIKELLKKSIPMKTYKTVIKNIFEYHS